MSPRMKYTLLVIGALWLFAFFKGSFWHDKQGANDVDLLTDAAVLRNFRLNIVQKEKLPDGSCRLVAECTYRDKPAGFEILVRPKRKNEKSGYEGQVVYRSMGPESDRFLEMLNEAYVTGLAPKAMAKEARFMIEAANGDPKNMDQSTVRMNLIYPAMDSDHYALFDTEVDFNGNRLYFEEHDIRYRKPVLLTLRGE